MIKKAEQIGHKGENITMNLKKDTCKESVQAIGCKGKAGKEIVWTIGCKGKRCKESVRAKGCKCCRYGIIQFHTSVGIGEMCVTGHSKAREGIFLGNRKQPNELCFEATVEFPRCIQQHVQVSRWGCIVECTKWGSWDKVAH